MKYLKTFEQFVNENINEANFKSLAKDIAELIGTGLDPMSFYEYLEDYSKDQPNGEYGFDEDQLTTLSIAFDEVEQGAARLGLNTSQLKSNKLYKAYLKESVNEGLSYDDLENEYEQLDDIDSGLRHKKSKRALKIILGDIKDLMDDYNKESDKSKQADILKDLDKEIAPWRKYK